MLPGKTTLIVLGLSIAAITVTALPRSSVVTDSEISNTNKNVKTVAKNKSTVNTGIQARSSRIAGSTIINENKDVRINATNRSEVNTGVKADNANIQDSHIENKFTGKIDARNSNVDTGINVSNGTVFNSKLRSKTKAEINAVNSEVTTGIKTSRATFADINTKADVKVNAYSSKVNLGTVSGDVDFKNIKTDVNQSISDGGANINVGTVKIGKGTPKWQQHKSFGQRKSATIGTVGANGARLEDAKISVGSQDLNEKLLVKHMNRLQNMRDDKGRKIYHFETEYIYVDKKTKNKVLQKGGSVGNYSGKKSKVRIFVE